MSNNKGKIGDLRGNNIFDVENDEILKVIADNMETCTYLIDLDTFKIIFSNSKTKEVVPEALAGNVCYEVIRKKSAACEDCPLKRLNGGEGKCETEIYNEALKVWVKVKAEVVKLDNGKKCGIMNSYDIVEYKNTDGKFIVQAEAFTGDATLYNALCKSTDDYIYMADMKKNIFFFPESMVEEFGLPNQVMDNAIQYWGAMIHENDQAMFFSEMGELSKGTTKVYNQEYRVKNKSGNWVWLSARGSMENDANGEPSLFAGIITNLGKKSKIDYLSGLLNKYEFENEIKAHLENKTENLGILILGIDNFKFVNNLYGWEFGDDILRNTAQKLQGLLPEDIQIYRLDGDIFGIHLPNTNKREIRELYNRVSVFFQKQQEYKGHKYYCTLSCGAVIVQNETLSLYALIKRAEYALEHSKELGRNRISFYNTETMAGKDRSVMIMELLRESVDLDFRNFELNYQPKVKADTGEIIGAEALLRWKCDAFGQISPVEFIPYLEETGLITPVGRWVIEQSIITCGQWRKLNPTFVMSANLSYLQLLENNFLEFLENKLEEYGIEPAAFNVELTESCIASGSKILREAFEKMRAMGINIEMDDFGTGYSSLEILKNEPADIVKIDRAFVKDIAKSDFDATFIKFVVALCHSVDIWVCLEGVETREEYDLVKKMEVDFIQGYYFGRPTGKINFEKEYL